MLPGDRVMVHHSAFGGMPSMSMEFAVPHGTALRAGEQISADVDAHSDPWTLSNVRVIAAAPATPAPRATLSPLVAGSPIPDPPFVDARGRVFRLDSLRGRPYALAFIYTRCHDPRMCPLVSAKFASLQRMTAHDPAHLVEVTLDPVYDRPQVLARYGRLFDADPRRWHLLTGQPLQVAFFAAQLGISAGNITPSTIIHTERLAVVGSDGKVAKFFDNATWDPADVATALRDASRK
jgi:protein SCO1/2